MNRFRNQIFILMLICLAISTKAADPTKPIILENLIFEEKGGFIAIEAEHFSKQSSSEIRKWYITQKDAKISAGRDEDGVHLVGASGNAYIEILPDTRVTAGDKLIDGENFSNLPGKMAVVHYPIYFNTPGRYYVWARIFSAGAEDNGLHVGVDNTWPESGMRMQWCDGKNSWAWASKQRTEKEHCGVPYAIYLDIDKVGVHDVQFSLREDGFELDKFILTNNKEFVVPTDGGPISTLKSGTLPKPFAEVKENPVPLQFQSVIQNIEKNNEGVKILKAIDFPIEETMFYKDKNWLAINPSKAKEAQSTTTFAFDDGVYDIVFLGVGEIDGKSSYKVLVNNIKAGNFTSPTSDYSFEEGPKFCDLWENITLKKGDKITVVSKCGSNDDKEWSRGRFAGIAFAPMTKGKIILEKLSRQYEGKKAEAAIEQVKEPILPFSNKTIRGEDGDGSVEISGELKQWHKVTVTMNGPYAHELDDVVNPFTDYRMTVTFTHESGSPTYNVPGYFAADGNAGESSADSGTKWKAHFSPDKIGKWSYKISFIKGKMSAISEMAWNTALTPFNGIEGSINIEATDKTGKDFRAKGRLEYVGKHYLQFKGTGEYFFKAGADAPETFLAYKEFDGTYAMKTNVPLKTYTPHLPDWKEGNPTWKNGQGKSMIGALNYLSSKGINAFSFLTYNASGDGDNVWPFVTRSAKFNYDCSKLDQWGVVFDYAQSLGLYLHFKTQETENDDNNRGKMKVVPCSLDGGDLGAERRLYYRELIARYGYLLALNWNLGEENTQSLEQRQAMAKYFKENDPYRHNIVIHTYPGDQNKVYAPMLGKNSELTGVSLQNEWNAVHDKTRMWVSKSDSAGVPWVVANDEQGSAGEGVPPDPGYKGYKANTTSYDIDDIRKQTLWGNIMAGGAGVEYYFGYKLPENDLICEDYRSRDKSWDYCSIAISFLRDNKIPFWEMKNNDALVENPEGKKEKYCFAKPSEIYMVYLAYTPTSSIDLTKEQGAFKVSWFDPKKGGKLQSGSVKKVKGGSIVELGNAPSNVNQDWVVLLQKEKK